jgi:hypothetical protein
MFKMKCYVYKNVTPSHLLFSLRPVEHIVYNSYNKNIV